MIGTEGTERPAALILAGGGIDSTVCVHQLRAGGYQVRALHVNFGQLAASMEWAAVQRIARHFGIEASQIAVHGTKDFAPGEIQGRNAMFLALAQVYREKNEQLLCIGIHAGTGYYDCGPAFFESIASLVASGSDGCVRVIAPLIRLQKSEIVSYCRAHEVPIHLTYSCQLGAAIPCGECRSCKDRRQLSC